MRFERETQTKYDDEGNVIGEVTTLVRGGKVHNIKFPQGQTRKFRKESKKAPTRRACQAATSSTVRRARKGNS